MIIDRYDITLVDGVFRVQATVTLEDADKPSLRVFAEKKGRFLTWVSTDPNALLLACLFPVWRDGERRVFVDDSILRWNQLRFAPARPLSIRGIVLVDYRERPSRGSLSESGRFRAAAEVASTVGISFLPVRTNVWWLAEDGYFFDEVFHGALLSSAAWFFSSGFNRVYIASSYTPEHLRSWDSRPLADPSYSGGHFATEHHGLWMSGVEKTALIADWREDMESLRVCQNDDVEHPSVEPARSASAR